MALKTLLLRSKKDKLEKNLEALRSKDEEFQKREAELETAIAEMTEETSDEDRKEVEDQAEVFQKSKDDHEKEKSDLEEEIKKIETEIEEEERKAPVPVPKRPEQRKDEMMMGESRKTRFFGMTVQERDAFFARNDVKDFLDKVKTCIKEKRALSNVGLTIPEVALELLKEKVYETSKLIGRVTVRRVNGAARQRIMGSIPEAVWTEMCAKLNELDLDFNDVEVDGYKVGGFFAVCNAILEDNDVHLMSEILNALGKAIGKALDKAIVYGKGTKMPMGIVTRLVQNAKPDDYPATAREWKDLSTTNIITGTGKTGVALFQEIASHAGVIVNDYFETGMVWIMNKKTHLDLTIQSMDKNLNAAIVAGINNSMPVVGGEIIELPFMHDGDVAFGYMDAYLLAERAGTKLGQSEHVRFLEDQTVFKGTARYDGEPVIPEAFGLFSIKATAPTTSVDFPADLANNKE